jgi:hypothetical protein
MILNKLSWKINLSSPADLVNILINKYDIDDNRKTIIINTFNDWVGFCLNESAIYYKYNQYEVSLACLYLSYRTHKMNNICIQFKNLIDTKLMKTISTLMNPMYQTNVNNNENLLVHSNCQPRILGMKRLRGAR